MLYHCQKERKKEEKTWHGSYLTISENRFFLLDQHSNTSIGYHGQEIRQWKQKALAKFICNKPREIKSFVFCNPQSTAQIQRCSLCSLPAQDTAHVADVHTPSYTSHFLLVQQLCHKGISISAINNDRCARVCMCVCFKYSKYMGLRWTSEMFSFPVTHEDRVYPLAAEYTCSVNPWV